MHTLRRRSLLTTFLALLALALPQLHAADCNINGIEDACDIDCGVAAGPCDVPGCGLSADCDLNAVPDECDIGSAPSGCSFPTTLFENTTSALDSRFLGAPDGSYRGLGGQIVTYELDCAAIVDGAGPDFNIYEVGGYEYNSIDVFVSGDGINFFNINEGRTPRVAIPGDLATGAPRGFDLRAVDLGLARYVRIDGVGAGSDGTSTGFDLDAMGVINGLGLDCDANTTLDRCQSVDDCNDNGVPESCEFAMGLVGDCDSSGTPDTCDTAGGVDDCDGDLVPDVCEADCNTNATPDDCDIAAMSSDDCNLNFVPDECDLADTAPSIASGQIIPIGGEIPRTASILSPAAAAGDVTVSVTAFGDFDATGEYLDIDLNGVPLGRLFDAAGLNCSATTEMLVVSADTFNSAIAGGDAVFTAAAPAAVNALECTDPYITIGVAYSAGVDCNTNTMLDYCDIDSGTSTDLNLNSLADECEPDCNGTGTPDDYDVAQGISPDCNGNGEPDECDLSAMTSPDCNTNAIPDECETDCNGNGIPDDCDLTAMTSPDCNGNANPDECDAATADTCNFPNLLLDNSTAAADSIFLGPPDGAWFGIGGQIVTFEMDCAVVVDGPGNDFNIYEYSGGGPEFQQLDDVLVSQDGVNFFSVIASEDIQLSIPGDELHTNAVNARAYDVGASGLGWARYLRIDGVGTSASGLFDLDAVGFLNILDNDCDGNNVPDSCQALPDCNGNGLFDICEVAVIDGADCNTNGTLDTCDIVAATSNDCNADLTPDECQPDCNGNATADVCELLAMTAEDCNGNALLDECEFPLGSLNLDLGTQSPLATGYSQDFALAGPFIASGPVSLTVTASGDYGSSNEFIDIAINGTYVGRVFASGGPQCAESSEAIVMTEAQFNAVLTGGDAIISLSVPNTVTSLTCPSASARVELAYDTVQDCNGNMELDFCDFNGGASANCNANGWPDECDISMAPGGDCNLNGVPDDCDVALGDCNHNSVPDDCDVTAMTSQDCNADMIPDECPVCPTVEITIAMDGSNSMTDEGDALCADLAQIVADLEADLVDVDTEILAIDNTLRFVCMEEGIPNRYGTVVPGTPPPGNETLGDCTGNQSDREDWGPATSVIAGNRPWSLDSVRLIIPIGDEGPRCGSPTNDPGDDRESINHAINVSLANNVVVSPITGTGSSAGVVTLATQLGVQTGGAAFSSSDPVNDLSQGIFDIIVAACDDVGDCNDNDVPDSCDLSSMTSQDCDLNGVPDECETDCNVNGILDLCDITNLTSVDSNSNSIPDECEQPVLTMGAGLDWTAVPGAIGYDVVYGLLDPLRASGGDFASSTVACLINDDPGLHAYPPDPIAPGGFWFLVRAILGTGNLSYDVLSADDSPSRDAGILASGNDCP